MSRELRYGLIAGFITLGWMGLGYALKWEQSDFSGYTTYFCSIILALTIYLTILHKRDRDQIGIISFRQAFSAGVAVSFVIGLLVGAMLMVYVKYINPDYVNEMIRKATTYYQNENATQKQIDNVIASTKATYSPFGQLTYGIGMTMLTGILITLVCALLMRRESTVSSK